MRAALLVLADVDYALSPNEIGYGMRALGYPVPRRVSRQGRAMGSGSMIVSTLKALERRGWIAWASRRDDLSGVAYVITTAGRREIGNKDHDSTL